MTQRESRHPSVLQLAGLFTAVALFGLAGVLGRLTGLPALLVTLGRVVFAAPALAALVTARRQWMRPPDVRTGATLVGQGLLLALHWTAFFQAIRVSSVAVGLLSFATFPLFTSFLEPMLLGDRPRRSEIVASLLVLPGVFLLGTAPTVGSSSVPGVLWGLLAAATFALLSVMNRSLTRRLPSLLISFYQDGVAAAALVPVLLWIPRAPALTPCALGLLLLLGVGCTAIAHTLFIESMRHVTAQAASLAASLEPVWGIGFAYVLLSETPAPNVLLGGMLILSAALIPVLTARAP
jgi:drug/metabolite transporter (DMT)-like permease